MDKCVEVKLHNRNGSVNAISPVVLGISSPYAICVVQVESQSVSLIVTRAPDGTLWYQRLMMGSEYYWHARPMVEPSLSLSTREMSAIARIAQTLLT